MITLAPSNNITNIRYSETHLQNELAEHTALETFAIVEKALNDSNTLEDVVIVELPPRVDSERLQELTEYSNFILRDLVSRSSLKHKITVASLDALWDYHEQDIYGHPSSPRYDGIHMRGKYGSKAYTQCIIEAVRSSKISSNTTNHTVTSSSSSPIPTSNRYQVLSS